MRKQLLFLLIFTHQLSSFGQCLGDDCIPSSLLALLTYEVVYQRNSPRNYPPSDYACPSIEFFGDSDENLKVKTLGYLDYGDGVTPLTHLSAEEIYLFPNQGINRFDAVVMMMEAFNIQPDVTGSINYRDVDRNSLYFGYINEAEDQDLFNGLFFGSRFNGFNQITRSEVVRFLANISNSRFHPIADSVLRNENNYFLPNNFTPQNLGVSRGLSEGVFSHYAKNSFVIPDIKLNLNFSHYYSTALVELPQSYFPIQPLGRGWTHTYNSYIIQENNVGENNNDDYYYIVWPDGTIHIYDEDENEYVTHGVYDELQERSQDRIEITTKNQIHYFYEQLDDDKKIFYLIKIEDRNGNEIDIEYERSDVDNDFERIKEVISPSGKKLTFEYHNNTDFIKKINDPIDRNIEFEYNEERLKEFKDAKNQETRYSYLSNDEDAPENHQYKRFLLRRVRLPRGNSIRATYDNNNDGKLKSYQIDDDEPIEVSTEFFTRNNSVESTVRVPMPDGRMQDFVYNYDENNALTHFENDTQDIDMSYPSSGPNVLIPNQTSYNGVTFDYRYDDKGNMTRRRAEGIINENYLYNDFNDVTQFTDSRRNIISYSYNSRGNLIQIADQLLHTTVFDVNLLGQVESVTNPEGIVVNYEYENDGALEKVTAPENQESTFTYDGINRMLSKTVNGQTSSYLYDRNDNMTSMTNIGGYTTVYDYDANDNVISITNAKGVATSFVYDDEDRVISETFGNLTKQYSYDSRGFQENYTKPSGDVVNYAYDREGRLKEIGTITDIDYNSRDLVSHIANNDSELNFTYDNINRVTTVEDTFNNVEVHYQYDDNGNITRIIYPPVNGINVSVRYTYDRKNRMTRALVVRNGVETPIANYSYLDDNRLNIIDYGNRLRTSYSYDEVGRLTGCSTVNLDDNQSEIYDHQITLDRRSNIIEQHARYANQNDSEPSTGGPGFIPGNNTPNNNPVFGGNSSNATGNRTNQNLTSTPELGTVNYSYDENNHISGNSHRVNNDGNTTRDDFNTYRWDIDDRITRRTTRDRVISTYRYNPYNQRISKTVDGIETKYIWDVLAENIIATTNASGTTQQYYIYGRGGLEAIVTPNGDITYLCGDHRGNVTTTTNQGGEIIAQYTYDDFGNYSYVGTAPQTDSNTFTFMGKYGIPIEDSEQGLYYVRARYYNASIGRFLSEDPIWGTNLYPYSHNNPLKYVDPSGEIPLETVLDVVSIGLSAAEFGNDPSLVNGLFLAWDIAATIIPYAPGSYAVKGSKYVDDVIKTTKKIHGNSKLSDKVQHGYKILDKNSNVLEYGISGQKLNKNGSSPRIKAKIREKYNNSKDISGEIIERNIPNRNEALNWEKSKVNDFYRKYDRKPKNQFRP